MKKLLGVCSLVAGLAVPFFASAVNLPITQAQKEYLQHEIVAIVHWGINTYTGQEWGDGEPSNMNSITNTIGYTIDTHQWVRAMKAGGIREVIMVSKHHDGFCLWPAENNPDYSTATLTNWPGFHNYNVPSNVCDACKKEGLAFGIYISPWDRHQGSWGLKDDVTTYPNYFHAQYQYIFDSFDVSEIWFDGAQGDYGYYGGKREKRKLPMDAKTYYDFAKLRDELSKDHPNAVIFGGDCSNSVVWAGNESGYMDENWNYTRQESGGGYYFGAAEVDTPFGSAWTKGQGEGKYDWHQSWFWHNGYTPKKLSELVDHYFTSVGRGGVLNLGIAPDQQGLVPDNEVQRLKEFGDYVKVHNASDLFADATVQTNTTSTSVTLTLTRNGTRQFNVVDFGENLDKGQFVTGWKVEVREGRDWRAVASGGRACWRRMARLGEVVSSDAVRITATGDTTPTLERIHVRYVPTVSSWNEQVDYGDSDAQMWHVRDGEGYHVLPTIGNRMSFNLPDELVRYELEIRLTNVNNAVTFEGYPSFLTLTDEDGNDMRLSVTPPNDQKKLFLTSKHVTGTQAGTLVGTVNETLLNNDAQSLGKWIAGTDTTMTLTLRNEGSRLALYKDGELILKTDKNFGNSGKVKTVTIGTDLATLSGAIESVRYREVSGVDVEGVRNAAYLWLDASDGSTILTNEAGAVTNWLGKSATLKGATAYTNDQVTAGPTVALTSRGKRVVDFGAVGSGRDLEFDRSSGIRTVVMVAQIATGTQDAFFLGDHGEDNFDFHRGENGEYFHGNHGEHFADGTYHNGVKVADPFHTQVPEGCAVYTFVADAAVKANGLCQDRAIAGRSGGKQVAELMIFNGYLGVEERLALEDYLWEKWCAKYTAVVEGDTDFSKIAWTPEKPAGGFTLADILTITNAATKATVTMDENLTAGGLSVLSAAGHDLLLQPQPPTSTSTVGAYDFSGANGKVSVGFPVGDAMVVSGRDTSFASSGTGLLYIGEGMQATAPDWMTWSSLVNRGVFAWAIPDTVTWNSVTNIPGALKIVKGTLAITGGGASKESYHFKNDTEVTGEGTRVVFNAKEALGWNESLTELFTISDGAVVQVEKLQKFGRPLVLNGGTIKMANDSCDNEGRGLDLPNAAGITAKAGTTNTIGGMTAGAINESGRIVIQCDGFPFVVEDSATLDIYSQVGWTDAGVKGFLSKTMAKTGGGRLAFYRAPLQTGAFALNQGTLALSGEGRPTTGTITAALGTPVEVGYGDEDQTVTNVIAGEGVVRKVGAGTTTLSGASTYSGGTLIENGALVVGHTAAFGTGAIKVNGGAWLNLGNHRLENEVKGDGVVVVQLTAEEEKSETVRLFKLGQKTLAGLSVAVWSSEGALLTSPKLDVDQDGYCVLIRKDVAEPITATIGGDVTWDKIQWFDANGNPLPEGMTPDGLKATITVTGNATISVGQYVRMRSVTIAGSGRLTFSGTGLVSLGEVTINCAVGGTYVADRLVYGANAEVDLRAGSPASWTTVTYPDPIKVRVTALPGAGEQVAIVTAEGDGQKIPNVALYVGEGTEPVGELGNAEIVWGYAGLYLRDRSVNASFEPLDDPATKSRNWVWFDADCGLDSTAWENRGLIVGNGRLGAMVMENCDKTRLALNEISLWSGGTCDDVGYSYGPYAGKDKFGSYQPFGDFFAEFDGKSGGAITRALDLTTGLAQATVVKDDVTYTREVFASRSNSVVVVRYKANRYGSLTGKLSLWPDHTAKTEVWLDLTTNAKDAVLSFTGTLANGMAFAATAYVVAEGGTLSPSLLNGETVSVTYTGGGSKDSSMPVRSVESAIRVDGANELTVVFAMETDYAPDRENAWKRKDGTPYELALKTAKAAAEKGANTLQAESVAAHRALFDRFELDLGKTSEAQYSQPTPKRLAAYRQGTPDPELEATHTQFGRYCLIGSAGGVLPANLQGIWNDKVHAPWASDYHNNINLQEAYWAAEVTGLSELHQSLFAWLDAVAPDARLVTQKNFKCATNDQVAVRGWTARISQNPFGGHGWEQWNTSINAWYALHYWEHYQFARGRDFLAKRAYPMMKEACQFWEDYLKELKAGGKNFYSSEWLTSKQQAQVDATPAGTLVAPKGWSHEWGPTEDGIAYDQQLIRNLFGNTAAAAKVLDVDAEWIASLTNKLAHLAPDKIADGGYLQEWYVDRPDKISGHRHTSHLFAVYPGAEINTVETPELAAAAKKSLELRGQSGDCNRSWTFPWRCALWARLKEPAKAYGMVNGLLTKKSPNGYYNTLDNLLTCHEPFQMDGNFSIPAAVCEMLVQSQVDGTIELLPAVDASKWPNGHVRGLRARNGITVDFAWENGVVQSFELKADAPTPVKVVMGARSVEVTAPCTWKLDGTFFYLAHF